MRHIRSPTNGMRSQLIANGVYATIRHLPLRSAAEPVIVAGAAGGIQHTRIVGIDASTRNNHNANGNLGQNFSSLSVNVGVDNTSQ